MKKLLKYLLPTRLKKPLKLVFYSILDLGEFLTGKKKKNYPPRRLNFVGSVDFQRVGNEFQQHFIKIGHLKPHDQVLDIGSGVGRMALPLLDLLTPDGSYLGFDIVKKGVEWCQKNITPSHPNVRFVHANVYNQYYNDHGTIRSEDYRFPAADETFTFCFATSVFTHMLPSEVERYLAEASRVMKRGGRVLFTFFLLPDSVQNGFETHCINFQYPYGDMAWYSHKDCPEAEIGYREGWVRERLKTQGFKNPKIHPGKWRDTAKGLSYQDIIVAEKG